MTGWDAAHCSGWCSSLKTVGRCQPHLQHLLSSDERLYGSSGLAKLVPRANRDKVLWHIMTASLDYIMPSCPHLVGPSVQSSTFASILMAMLHPYPGLSRPSQVSYFYLSPVSESFAFLNLDHFSIQLSCLEPLTVLGCEVSLLCFIIFLNIFMAAISIPVSWIVSEHHDFWSGLVLISLFPTGERFSFVYPSFSSAGQVLCQPPRVQRSIRQASHPPELQSCGEGK